jgi:hypothetical protein
MNLDDKMFSASQVGGLSALIPTPEDMETVKGWVADPSNEKDRLGPAEKFTLALDLAPNIKERLKAFKYMVDFEPKKIEIKPDIDSLKKASKQVKDSSKLTRLFEIVLHLGNFLNAGTNNGQAWGFKLSSLNKLCDTKTTDNKASLMDYMVEMVEKQNGDLLSVKEDLEAAPAAVRVSLQQLQGELGKLTGEFNNVKKLAETIPSAGPTDQFHEKIKAFFVKAEAELQKMNEDYKDAEAEYSELCKLYGEDPKNAGPDEGSNFFKYITTFVDNVEVCNVLYLELHNSFFSISWFNRITEYVRERYIPSL